MTTDIDNRAAVDEDSIERIGWLCDRAFGAGEATVTATRDVNLGRGAFSLVLQAQLAWADRDRASAGPPSVVAKLPVPGPNGRAAIESGAYQREAIAYRVVLSTDPIGSPRIHVVDEPGDGTCSLLMEDLSDHRSVDQLAGLTAGDALVVAEALSRFHRRWADSDRLAPLPVRRNTISLLPADGLAAGLTALETSWSDAVDAGAMRQFVALVDARSGLADRADVAPQTLCHGDPRADNLVFDPAGQVVLFDWQQMAVQFGEADLAWLAATSLDVATRRTVEAEMVAAHGGSFERYRLGLALPGLAVLLLAQRHLSTVRTKRLVALSLERISTALADHDVAALG